MNQTANLPERFDQWSEDARQAYQQLLIRAENAEKALSRIRDTVITPNAAPASIGEIDNTLNWQTMMVTEVQRLSQQALNSNDPTNILYEITELLTEIMQGTSACICSWNPEMGGVLVLADYHTPDANERERVSRVGNITPTDDEFEQRLLQSGQWITYRDSPNKMPNEQAQFDLCSIKALICTAMLTADGKLIGYVEVRDTYKQRTYNQHQTEFMQIIARQFTGAVRNAGLLRVMQQSEARYSMLISTMNEGLVQINQEGIILYANEHFGTLIGQSAATLKGMALEKLWNETSINPPQLPHSTTDAIQEMCFQRPDGSLIWVQVSSAAISDMRGEVNGYVHVYTDITQRRIAEQHAVELALEQERVRILSEFIRDASHEFYTPISIITTRVYLLKRLIKDAEFNQQLEPIQVQADAMMKLVNDLITMTSLDSSSASDLHLQQTNICHLVSYGLNNLNKPISEKRIQMQVNMEQDPIWLMLDGEKVLRAFQAILQNAINHTPSAGIIRVRVWQDADYARIDIQDSGSGINPEVIEHIFKRFYRSDNAHSTRGFGLGLPIARRAIQLHHGTIEVESPPQSGAIFRILLPITPVIASS